MRYVTVNKNGVVKNAIEWNGIANIVGIKANMTVVASDTAEIGDTYDGVVFTPKVPNVPTDIQSMTKKQATDMLNDMGYGNDFIALMKKM